MDYYTTMTHTYYISAIALTSALTFYLTRRHYYRPSAPLPLQQSSEPITIPIEATTELETPQDGINKIVDVLSKEAKARIKMDQADKSGSSWMSMNDKKG